MPIRTIYTVVDGEPALIEQRCSVEDFLLLGDAAFDGKPQEVILAQTPADRILLSPTPRYAP